MGCLETCCALQDCSDYLIASEDFVSGYGWEYQYWLTELGDDVSMPTEELGRTIVDTYVQESEQAGDPGVLALIDLSKTPALYAAWTEFAYANEAAPTAANYSWATQMSPPGRQRRLARQRGEQVMQDYYITDLMALACTLDCEESSALGWPSATRCSTPPPTARTAPAPAWPSPFPTATRSSMPAWREIFPRCGLDQNYVSWLGRFASAPGSGSFYGQWDSWGRALGQQLLFLGAGSPMKTALIGGHGRGVNPAGQWSGLRPRKTGPAQQKKTAPGRFDALRDWRPLKPMRTKRSGTRMPLAFASRSWGNRSQGPDQAEYQPVDDAGSPRQIQGPARQW